MSSYEKRKQKAAVKETFDTISSEYDSPALRFFPESAAYLASSLKMEGHEQVLDVATGSGHAALAVAKCLPQGHVTGIDFSSGMLDQARRKAAVMDIRNVDFIEMDMQSMKFEHGRFDVALCAFGIFFVPDMDKQLVHIAEMVKEDGVIAVCSFHEKYMMPLRKMMADRLAGYGVPAPPQPWKRVSDECGCVEFFERAGLRDIQVEQKDMGYFLEDETQWWDVIWNAGYRRLVSQLSPEDLERLKEEHLKEVAGLATEDGIWMGIDTLYTMGRK